MYAIVQCENLQMMWTDTKELAVQSAAGFSSISTNRVMTECVVVLDGYHMEIVTPPKKRSAQCQVLLLWLLPDIWYQHSSCV